MCQENSTFLEYVSQISIILASLTAIYGVNTWRREYRGKKDADLAEEALTLFYKAKDAISAIRNPFSFSNEGASRKPAQNEADVEKEFRDQAYIFFERYEKRQDVFRDLNMMRYRFMARFGKDKAGLFDSIAKITNKILRAANRWARLHILLNRLRKDATEKQQSQIDGWEEIIWDMDEEDGMNTEVAKIVNDVENICRPIITNTYSSTFTNVKIYFKIFVNSVFSVAKKIRNKMWKRE